MILNTSSVYLKYSSRNSSLRMTSTSFGCSRLFVRVWERAALWLTNQWHCEVILLTLINYYQKNLSQCSWDSRSSKNRAFWRVHPNLMAPCEGLLEPRGSKLTLLKSPFCVGNFMCKLSWSICSNFGAIHSCNMRRSVKSRKMYLKLAIFGFQGRLRSSMLVFLERSSAVLLMISSKCVSICSSFYARQANSD